MYEESNGDNELPCLQAPVQFSSSAESISAFPSNTVMYMRKKPTSDPDFSLDADWRSYQSFSNQSHRAKYWMETGVVDEQTVFAVNSTDWKLKCRNSTDLWRPTVPWWLRSLSALPSPTLLCISALQPGTHSLAGTDKVTITWMSLVFHRKSTTGVVFVSVFL